MRLSSSFPSELQDRVVVSPASRSLKRLGLLGVALALPLAAHAQFTYTGGGANGNFSTPGNFTPSTPPTGGGTGVTLTFTGAPATLATVNDLGNPFTLNSLTFAAGAGAYSISGSTLNFAGTTPSINVNNSAPINITAPITLASDTVFTGGGSLNVAGGINGGGSAFSANGSAGSILNLTGGASVLNFGFFGRAAGSNITASISGASTTFTNTTQLSVGGAGTASLAVSGGAVATAGQGLIGGTGTGNGSLTVTGNGSRFVTNGTGGPTDTPPTGSLTIGRDASSIGSLTLSGGGSAAINYNLVIGNSGTGTLNITAPGANNVNAPVTTLAVANDVGVGNLNGGVGNLNISGGGTYTARDTVVGSTSGAQGTVTVTEGSLGGRVLFIAPTTGATGNVTVTGATSTATLTDNIEVGGQGGVAGGTASLTVSSGAVVTAAATMNIYGPGTVNVNTGTVTTGSLSTGGVTSGTLAITNGTFNTGADNTSTLFNGSLNGAGGSFNKSGSGTLTLGGTSAYTGPVNLGGGALNVTGALASTGAVNIGSGATLRGTGSVGNITLNNGGFVQPGAVGSLAVLTGSSLLWNPGGRLNFDLGISGTSDLLTLNGALTKGGPGAFVFNFNNIGIAGTSSFTLIGANTISGFAASDFSYTGLASNFAGSFQVTPNQVILNVVAVPEGSTLGLALLGLTGLAPLALRRLRAKNG